MPLSYSFSYNVLLCPFSFYLKRVMTLEAFLIGKLKTLFFCWHCTLNTHAAMHEANANNKIQISAKSVTCVIVGIHAFNNVKVKVMKRMQHCCSYLRKKEMLDDVEANVWWKSNFVQHHPTPCDIHTNEHKTWIQQCWMIFHQHVKKKKRLWRINQHCLCDDLL